MSPAVLQSSMKMLFSAYRIDQYPDPDGFMAQAAAVLSEYSEAVVLSCTNPHTGIQRRQKWPPTVFELGEACDQAKGHFEAERKLAAKGMFWSETDRKHVQTEKPLAAYRNHVGGIFPG